MSFENQRAVVLGGTSGIGLASALRLREAGADVVVAGRSEGNLAKARDLGLEARALDVLDRESMATFFSQVAPIDVLVNAATGGGRALGPFADMDLDAFQGSFRKLWGYTNSVHIGAPHLRKQGSIVLVSGAPARRPRPGQIALSCVGAAVEAFVRGMARELAPIRINAVSPGVIDTPLIKAQGEEREKLLGGSTAKNPVNRPGSADEVATAVLFALSNQFVTGTVIDVDGGWLAP